jgi:hypothetical protein
MAASRIPALRPRESGYGIPKALGLWWVQGNALAAGGIQKKERPKAKTFSVNVDEQATSPEP